MPIRQLKPKSRFDQDHEPKKNKKKKRKGSIFQTLITIIVFLGLVGAIGMVAFIAIISRDLPSTDGLITRVVPESSKIYDSKGETILYQISGDERRTEIDISDLPPHVSNAFIAIEDKDFYSHKGIIWKRFVKAVYDDSMYMTIKIIPKSIREKFNIKLPVFSGFSTITQQLVKNAILTPEKRITRKAKEMILAWQMEKRFTKEQILKMYLNEISYGGVNYGIESAAQSYFGKPASGLTIAESAILAAMVQSPTRLSPYGNNKDDLISRQQFILSLMFEQSMISLEEYEQAKHEELEFKVKRETILAPHFVMYVRQLLEEDFGAEYSEQLLKEGGLKIYTTLDMELQQLAEEVVSESKDHLEENGADNTALVAIDPKTGHILAMVGSRDYFDTENDGNFNAALGLRQPGSSIKPLVYVSAFQKGFYPESVVYDVKTNFDLSGRRSYIPLNYDLKENGAVSLRKALAGSLNIPAVKALYLVGVDNVSKIAGQLGYTTLGNPDRYGLALVLGGAEVKLLEHVSAYSAFANDGMLMPHMAITRIEDRDGKVIKEYNNESKRVLDSNAVRMLNSVLSDNNARSYAFGLQNILVVKDRVVAAKTGTTNDYRDAWTVGYTPSFVAGVWAGNNDNTEMNRGSGGSKVAGPIWNKFMSKALENYENEHFTSYPQNSSDNPALNGSLEQGLKVKIDTVSEKRATEYTPEDLIEEKVFWDMHSILHYVDKNSPGPIPEDPTKDPQYSNWEAAILDWVDRFNQKAEEKGEDIIEVIQPPEEEDDVHTPENKPFVEILSPSNGQTITESAFHISVNTYSSRGVDTVMYYIDDVLIGTGFDHPFSIDYEVFGISNGSHKLKAKSCDDVLNCEETEIDINLELDKVFAPIQIMSPSDNSSFYQSSFPLTLSLNVWNADTILSANVYYKSVSDSSANFIGSVENIIDGFNSLKWNNAPASGKYILYIEVIDQDNQTSESNEVVVEIL